jgi:HSP20 family protein
MRTAFYNDLLVPRSFQQLFNEFTEPKETLEFTPAYDVQEQEDKYLLSFDVPGIDRNDLNIELLGSKLTVSGERKTPGKRGRKFSLAFNLKDGVTPEQVEAAHKDGVLTLSIKKPVAARPAKIAVS